MNLADISLDDYNYNLPNENIAIYPSAKRDECKLLVYNFCNNNKILHTQFRNIIDYIPSDTLLIVNSTKVLPARILINKKTGATIEFLLLSPVNTTDYQLAMASTQAVTWKCIIGGRNIKAGTYFEHDFDTIHLEAKILKRWENMAKVEFSWQQNATINSTKTLTFGEILDFIGKTPLPPYLHRDVTPKDKQDYQTVYAEHHGSVAAPTAGLHFTAELLSKIKEKQIDIQEVVLHIGAGTFVPITTSVQEHKMHTEHFQVSKSTIKKLLQQYSHNKPVIATGTTSLRTLESLYLQGLELMQSSICEHETRAIRQCRVGIFEALLNYMERKGLEVWHGQTSLFITPGYKIKTVNGLITNFHLPKSTLLLLVSALVGTDTWKEIYSEALLNNYKFLSYGDASLLFRND